MALREDYSPSDSTELWTHFNDTNRGVNRIGQTWRGQFGGGVGAGAPVDVDIAIALREVSGGTDIHAITRIVSSVPLFGSMVESALEPYVESLLSERLDQLVDL